MQRSGINIIQYRTWPRTPFGNVAKAQENITHRRAKRFSPFPTGDYKAVLLLWIFYVFVLSCVCYVLCASVYMCFVVTCWERADLLALVCGVFCEFVTFPLVSWVRCGTWLYRFLIFAPLLTFKEQTRQYDKDKHETQTTKRIHKRSTAPSVRKLLEGLNKFDGTNLTVISSVSQDT